MISAMGDRTGHEDALAPQPPGTADGKHLPGTPEGRVDLRPYLQDMATESSTAERAAQVVEQVAERAPGLFATHVPSLISLLEARNSGASRVSAQTLLRLTRVAPAKVAKHLDRLRSVFEHGSSAVRDSTLQVLMGLCRASVVYQKRLIDLIERALDEADPATLSRWATWVLPALKGQPHFQARERIEARLPQLGGEPAEKLAALLGVSLRAG